MTHSSPADQPSEGPRRRPAAGNSFRAWRVRQDRKLEKEHAILDFLSTELVSNIEMMSELLRVSIRTANETVSRLEDLKLIRRERIMFERTPVHVLGITSRGQQRIADIQGRKPRDRTFLPRSVGISSIPHRLDLQRLRIALTAAGAEDWWPGVAYRVPNRGDVVPDAVCKCKGERLAIELERTIKSEARYAEVFGKHFTLIEAKKWGHVVYVCLTESDANRMRSLPSKIGSLFFDRTAGETFKREVEREQWVQHFTFLTREEAPEWFFDMVNSCDVSLDEGPCP